MNDSFQYYSVSDKTKRSRESRSPDRKFSTAEKSSYGLPGADSPVFGSVGAAALAAIGFPASVVYRVR